jgi:glucose-6-phosphate 1-dehydrogenase
MKNRTSTSPGPCALVLFGASGDLVKRLVTPALYNLFRTGLLPENFAVIGVDIAERTSDDWKASLFTMLTNFTKVDQSIWNHFANRMDYLQGDLMDNALYSKLTQKLDEVAKTYGTGGNVMFYCAVVDRFFTPLAEHLGQSGLLKQTDNIWRRIIVEKPFGHSLQSAKELNAHLLRNMEETQLFRIDHYLGKETVQNIMVFRFANGLFEPIWNRDRIDHVQITVAETVGVGSRGKFYEQTGALRDMVPNHVFQLLAMVAMEPPVGLDADAIRDKKADVFRAIHPMHPMDAVRGQYGAGPQDMLPYRLERDVAPNSNIETYVAMRLMVDNWRWAGVPFYIRTGKHLARRMTEIAIRFKQAPLGLFSDTPVENLAPNWLVIRIQPDEGIDLQFEVKHPGQRMELSSVKMDFRYKDWFPPEPNVGYETLIYDIMIGDITLFQRADMVEATWRIVQPVLDAWATKTPEDFPNYASGSEGPEAAEQLIQRRNFRHLGERLWRTIT